MRCSRGQEKRKKGKWCPHEVFMRTGKGKKGKIVSAWSVHEDRKREKREERVRMERS